MDTKSKKRSSMRESDDIELTTGEIENINASGHVQELDRNFNLWSIAGMAVTTGNTWIALAGTIVS